jgi:hypothetical protein
LMEEIDATRESVSFNLHNNPRLLASSAEEASKELFKQVQWCLSTFMVADIPGLQMVLLC